MSSKGNLRQLTALGLSLILLPACESTRIDACPAPIWPGQCVVDWIEQTKTPSCVDDWLGAIVDQQERLDSKGQ